MIGFDEKLKRFLRKYCEPLDENVRPQFERDLENVFSDVDEVKEAKADLRKKYPKKILIDGIGG